MYNCMCLNFRLVVLFVCATATFAKRRTVSVNPDKLAVAAVVVALSRYICVDCAHRMREFHLR